MLLYLLISVQCTISEPSKNFTLKCKPEVVKTYQSESDCNAQLVPQSACMTVRVGRK